jgi:beta-lactamase class C
MTQHERFRASEKFGQAMAWENVHLHDVDAVDKPAGLANATAYVGLVPAHKVGILLLANRGDFPHEIARYRVLPELARAE